VRNKKETKRKLGTSLSHHLCALDSNSNDTSISRQEHHWL